MSAKLIIQYLDSELVDDYQIGQRIPINREEIGIGKTEDCQLKFKHKKISREHAKLTYTSSGYHYIEDLDSTNGTFVNQQKLGGRQPRQLKNGDEIELSSVITFTFAFADPNQTFEEVYDPIRSTGLHIIPEKREVHIDRQKVEPALTKQEFAFLKVLVTAQGETVSRDEIANKVWSDDVAGAVSDEMIDKTASKTRKKLREYSTHKYIKTMRGSGFQFVQQES